jgi:hypothetical protein
MSELIDFRGEQISTERMVYIIRQNELIKHPPKLKSVCPSCWLLEEYEKSVRTIIDDLDVWLFQNFQQDFSFDSLIPNKVRELLQDQGTTACLLSDVRETIGFNDIALFRCQHLFDDTYDKVDHLKSALRPYRAGDENEKEWDAPEWAFLWDDLDKCNFDVGMVAEEANIRLEALLSLVPEQLLTEKTSLEADAAHLEKKTATEWAERLKKANREAERHRHRVKELENLQGMVR